MLIHTKTQNKQNS